MKKLSLLALLSWLALASPIYAANVDIPALPAAGSVGGTDLNECSQAGTSRKCTAAQMAAYVYGLTSGDITIGGTGTGTLATVNANVGSFGSTTNCITLTVNAKGLITAASQATCAPAVGSVTGFGAGVATWLATPSSANLAAAVTGETGTGALMFGTLPDITTGFTIGGAAASGQYIRGDGAKFVSSAIQAADLPVLTVTQRTESGANPALPSSDQTKLIYLSNGSNQIPTIAQAGTAGFVNGWFATYCNIGAGTQTVTPATSTIGGAATLLIPAGSAARPQCYTILSDGTNYTLSPQSGTVFTGTLALATSAISSAACSSAQTVTAPGVVTTDVPLLSFNADPTAVTGYVPLTAGMLTIIGYPTANTVNVKVCNNTSSSITPGAITLNVKVMR